MEPPEFQYLVSFQGRKKIISARGPTEADILEALKTTDFGHSLQACRIEHDEATINSHIDYMVKEIKRPIPDMQKLGDSMEQTRPSRQKWMKEMRPSTADVVLKYPALAKAEMLHEEFIALTGVNLEKKVLEFINRYGDRCFELAKYRRCAKEAVKAIEEEVEALDGDEKKYRFAVGIVELLPMLLKEQPRFLQGPDTYPALSLKGKNASEATNIVASFEGLSVEVLDVIAVVAKLRRRGGRRRAAQLACCRDVEDGRPSVGVPAAMRKREIENVECVPAAGNGKGNRRASPYSLLLLRPLLAARCAGERGERENGSVARRSPSATLVAPVGGGAFYVDHVVRPPPRSTSFVRRSAATTKQHVTCRRARPSFATAYIPPKFSPVLGPCPFVGGGPVSESCCGRGGVLLRRRDQGGGGESRRLGSAAQRLFENETTAGPPPQSAGFLGYDDEQGSSFVWGLAAEKEWISEPGVCAC
ncbi:hypothetical protein MRX96_050243 [Rhipicephalus microplus]